MDSQLSDDVRRVVYNFAQSNREKHSFLLNDKLRILLAQSISIVQVKNSKKRGFFLNDWDGFDQQDVFGYYTVLYFTVISHGKT